MPDVKKVATLQEAQKFVAALGCGQETMGPTVWRVTTPNEGTAKRVVDVLKKSGVFIYPPRTDPPDNAKPEEGREPVEPAIKDYPVGKVIRPPLKPGDHAAVIFTVDVGWEYVKLQGADQSVPQLAVSEPKPVKVEAKEE